MAIETSVKIKAVVEGLNQVQSSFDKLGRNLTKVGKSLSLGLTAPIAAFGIAGVAAFDKQAKAIAQVEAGLKSTGNQVGKTSAELQALASGLQNNSLFGDEDILSGVTSQLLTFTNIAGEQFEKTQQAALDLATRLDGDLKSASIQLGKALNDPAANLSALSRSGIQFSKDQVAVIKELQSTNRLAEAQTIILKELETQYGGSAQAAAAAGLGPFKQLQNSIGDLSEAFGGIIANAILPFVKSLQSIVAAFQELSPGTQRIITIFVGFAAAIGPILIIIGKLSVGLGVLSSALSVIVPAIAAFKLSIVSLAAATGIGLLIVGITAAVTKILEMKSELGSFSNVFTVIGLQINKFALQLRQKFSQAGNTVTNFFRGLVGAPLLEATNDAFSDRIASIDDQINFLKQEGDKAARDPANTIDMKAGISTQGVIDDINIKVPQIKAVTKPIELPAKITLDQELAVSNSILEGAQAANQGNLLDAQLEGASQQELNNIRVQGLRDYQATLQLVLADQQALNLAQQDPRVTDSINRIKQGLIDTDAEINKLTESAVTKVPSAFAGAASAFESFRMTADQGLQNLTSLGLNGITNALSSIVDGTKTAAQAFSDLADSIVKELIKIAIQKAITAAIGSAFPGTSSNSTSNSSLPGFADGTIFSGPGGPRSDSILARVSRGEAITKASSVAEIGTNFFRMINKYGAKGLEAYISGKRQKIGGVIKQSRTKIPRYQDGGIVEGGQQNRQSMPNLTINIENKSQARIAAIQPEGPSIQDQIKGIVYNVILEDAAVNGPLTRASGR